MADSPKTVRVLVAGIWQEAEVKVSKSVGEFADTLANTEEGRTFALKAGGLVLDREQTTIPTDVTLELIETREDGWQRNLEQSPANAHE